MCDILYLTFPTYALLLACLCGVLFVFSASVESLLLSLSARFYTVFLVTDMGVIINVIHLHLCNLN